MHAISPDTCGQFGVCRDQQNEPAPPANVHQPLCDPVTSRCSKMPIYHAKPAWQAGGDGFRVRRSDGIGHEQGGGQAGDAARLECPRTDARSGDQLAPRPALGF